MQNPNIAASEETKAILDKVGRHIVLPLDEQPTIATISDKEKLKDQPFFAKAKNGDKVLIYNLARKAILFDPVADKIIDVAPINISTPSATTTLTPLKIALYNGTNTSGLTDTVETDIKQKMDNIDVNRLGQSEETMLGWDLGSYQRRFEAFGWNTVVIDGHNFSQITQSFKDSKLQRGKGKPFVIIAKTVKGKGISVLQV